MHTHHLPFASAALFAWTGALFVAGSTCLLSSQARAFTEFLKGRDRSRRG